jgi:hypothetical protein
VPRCSSAATFGPAARRAAADRHPTPARAPRSAAAPVCGGHSARSSSDACRSSSRRSLPEEPEGRRGQRRSVVRAREIGEARIWLVRARPTTVGAIAGQAILRDDRPPELALAVSASAFVPSSCLLADVLSPFARLAHNPFDPLCRSARRRRVTPGSVPARTVPGALSPSVRAHWSQAAACRVLWPPSPRRLGATAESMGGLSWASRRPIWSPGVVRADPGRALCREDSQEVADPLAAGEWVGQGQVGLDRVVVAAPGSRET